jgi:hypothetical protein
MNDKRAVVLFCLLITSFHIVPLFLDKDIWPLAKYSMYSETKSLNDIGGYRLKALMADGNVSYLNFGTTKLGQIIIQQNIKNKNWRGLRSFILKNYRRESKSDSVADVQLVKTGRDLSNPSKVILADQILFSVNTNSGNFHVH